MALYRVALSPTETDAPWAICSVIDGKVFNVTRITIKTSCQTSLQKIGSKNVGYLLVDGMLLLDTKENTAIIR